MLYEIKLNKYQRDIKIVYRNTKQQQQQKEQFQRIN